MSSTQNLVRSFGTPQVWNVVEEDGSGFTYRAVIEGRFTREGQPEFRVSRDGVLFPDRLRTFEEAVALAVEK